MALKFTQRPPPSGPFTLTVPSSARSSSRPSVVGGSPQRKSQGLGGSNNTAAGSPTATSSRVLVEDMDDERPASKRQKKRSSPAQPPKTKAALSPVRVTKGAIWVEVDSDEEAEPDGATILASNILPSRRRASTADCPSIDLTKRQKRRRSSVQAIAELNTSPRKGLDVLADEGRKDREEQLELEVVKEAPEEEDIDEKEASPELGAPAIKATSEEMVEPADALIYEFPPTRIDITHDFFLNFVVRRKPRRRLRPSSKPSPPSARAVASVPLVVAPPITVPAAIVEDSEESELEEPSRPPRKWKGKGKQTVAAPPPRPLPTPTVSPVPPTAPPPVVFLPPTPIVPPLHFAAPARRPTPPLPSRRRLGDLFDRKPCKPPPLPRRPLNPDFEPTRLLGWVAGSFPPPTPPNSWSNRPFSLGGRPRGRFRAQSVEEPGEETSTSSGSAAAFLPPAADETSSGRTSVEPESGLRADSAPAVGAGKKAGASPPKLRRTTRVSIQAALPSAVASSRALNVLSVGSRSFTPLQPNGGKKRTKRAEIKARYAELKEFHGVGNASDEMDYEVDFGKETGCRNIRSERGNERWAGARARSWAKKERDEKALMALGGESEAEDSVERTVEQGVPEWRSFNSRIEVVPWEHEGIDLGRGRAWNGGEGMDPGQETHGKRWAVADPRPDESPSEDEGGGRRSPDLVERQLQESRMEVEMETVAQVVPSVAPPVVSAIPPRPSVHVVQAPHPPPHPLKVGATVFKVVPPTRRPAPPPHQFSIFRPPPEQSQPQPQPQRPARPQPQLQVQSQVQLQHALPSRPQRRQMQQLRQHSPPQHLAPETFGYAPPLPPGYGYWSPPPGHYPNSYAWAAHGAWTSAPPATSAHAHYAPAPFYPQYPPQQWGYPPPGYAYGPARPQASAPTAPAANVSQSRSPAVARFATGSAPHRSSAPASTTPPLPPPVVARQPAAAHPGLSSFRLPRPPKPAEPPRFAAEPSRGPPSSSMPPPVVPRPLVLAAQTSVHPPQPKPRLALPTSLAPILHAETPPAQSPWYKEPSPGQDSEEEAEEVARMLGSEVPTPARSHQTAPRSKNGSMERKKNVVDGLRRRENRSVSRMVEKQEMEMLVISDDDLE